MVADVKEFLPRAVLPTPPLAVIASKAFSPRAVLPAREFKPLPTVIPFIVASVVPVIAPVTSTPAPTLRLLAISVVPSEAILNLSTLLVLSLILKRPSIF